MGLFSTWGEAGALQQRGVCDVIRACRKSSSNPTPGALISVLIWGGLGAVLICPAAAVGVLECSFEVSFPWLDGLGGSAGVAGAEGAALGALSIPSAGGSSGMGVTELRLCPLLPGAAPPGSSAGTSLGSNLGPVPLISNSTSRECWPGFYGNHIFMESQNVYSWKGP